MRYDFTVVGAGIVGLSTAWKLMQAWPEARVLVLEKEDRVAAHQTGHNSGVIHSGIYYEEGSYKARNCVDGRHQLVEFCREHDVHYDICGKIVVATEEEELPRLEKIHRRGVGNGVEGIRMIGREEIREIEPHAAGIRALHVPCAGIVDFKGVCDALTRRIRERGGVVQLASPVDSIHRYNGSVRVQTPKERIETGYLVNCAGLYSDHVARSAGINPQIQIVPFRGEFFRLLPQAECLVRGLIYPLPNPAFPFLGVHFTKAVPDGVECGPNAVFAFKREGYGKLSFDLQETIETFNFPGFWRLARRHWRMGLDEYYRSFSREAFLKQLQKLIPAIRMDHLQPSPSGVRAMALTREGEIVDDFHFEKIDREIHVLNAPSPAATAALAIADEIVNQING